MDGEGTSGESSTHTSKERPDSCEKLSENVLRQRQSRAGAAGLAAEKPRIDQKDSPLLKLVKFAIAISSKLFKKADDKEGAASEQAIPAHMHMLYGELYDFTEFWQKHPGGEIALGLGVGRDATRLFESYHVFNDNHIKVMSKYKVDQTKPLVAPPPSAFHQDVRQMVREHFDGQSRSSGAHKATRAHWTLMMLLLLVEVCCVYGWAHGSWIACIAFPLVNWLLASNTSHDGSHFAMSTDPLVNQISVWTSCFLVYNPYTWYYQHVMSHHTNTNDVEHDCDLFHMSPSRLHHKQEHTDRHKEGKVEWGPGSNWQHFVGSTIYLSVLLPVAAAFGVEDIFDNPAPVSVHRVPIFHWLKYVLSTIPAFLVLWFPFTQFSAYKAVPFALIPFMLSSVCFMFFTQVSHLQPECQSEQVQNEADWIKQQAMTSLDYAVESKIWGFLSGGLNMQALHHVIPGVHSCHYRHLYPKYREVCKKHKIHLNECEDGFAALRRMWKYLRMLNARNPAGTNGIATNGKQ